MPFHFIVLKAVFVILADGPKPGRAQILKAESKYVNGRLFNPDERYDTQVAEAKVRHWLLPAVINPSDSVSRGKPGRPAVQLLLKKEYLQLKKRKGQKSGMMFNGLLCKSFRSIRNAWH